jgi:hypothetical protein
MNFAIRPCIIFLLISQLIFAGCSSTRIISSWRDEAYVSGQIKKPMVLAIVEKSTVRAQIEDEFVLKLSTLGIDALQSYKSLPDLNGLNADIIKGKLSEKGRDSVLVLRLTKSKKETIIVPNSTSNSTPANSNFRSYYSSGLMASSTSAYSVDLKVHTLESNLYAVQNDKLVWSAVTETETEDGGSIGADLMKFVDSISRDLKKKSVF